MQCLSVIVFLKTYYMKLILIFNENISIGEPEKASLHCIKIGTTIYTFFIHKHLNNRP